MVQKKSPEDVRHENRIKEELREADITPLGKYRFSGTYLPQIIHPDEHIEAAVFGRHKESEGFFGVVEGMLVATDRRVIFVDHRPGYTTMDEFTYDVVSGVNVSRTLLNSSVTLYTKVSNYHLSFVSSKSARRFADFIESRIEAIARPAEMKTPASRPYETILSGEALAFLENYEVGVLSTFERTGSLSSAVIYYTIRNGYPYFMTKEVTRKAGNLADNQHVAFTVYDEHSLETVQLTGIAELVTDKKTRIGVVTDILHFRTYDDGSHVAPVVRMGADKNTLVYRIVVTDFNYTNFINLEAQKTKPPQ